MANWKTKVKLTDLHELFTEEEITINELGNKLADRLDESPYRGEIQDLIDELREVADVHEYDAVLEELYDFGDEGHRIWFDSF